MIAYVTQISNELESIDRFMLQADSDSDRSMDRERISQKKNAMNLLHSLVIQSLDLRQL